MAQGIPILKDAPYNVLTVPNYVRDLVVTTAPGTIKAQYNPPDDPEATECWTTYKAGSYPEHPFDGKRVVTPLETPEIDAHTLFLWHADDMTDSSSAPKEITNHGAEIAEDAGAYGGKAGRFGGAQRLTAAASFTLDDFTVDFRIKHNGNAEWAGILCTAPTTLDNFTYFDGALNISFAAGNKLIVINTHGTPGVYDEITTASAVPTGRWVHVAVVRSAGVIRVYIDGKVSATLACATQVRTDGSIQIGKHDIRDGMYLSADIDEFRISDVARWTADFEPPLAAYGSREPVKVSMTEGVVNDTEYGVRVFARGRLGFQTRKGGAQAMVTPVAGLRLGDMETNPPTMITLVESGTAQRFRVLAHDYAGTTGKTLVMREVLLNELPSGGRPDSLYIGSNLDTLVNAYPERLVPEISAKVGNIALPCQNNLNDLTSVGTYQRRAFALSFREFGATDATVPDSPPYKLILMGNPVSCFATKENRIMALSDGYIDLHYTRDIVKHPNQSSYYYGAVDKDGSFTDTNRPYGGHPAVCFTLPADMLFSLEPNPDGSYSPIL